MEVRASFNDRGETFMKKFAMTAISVCCLSGAVAMAQETPTTRPADTTTRPADTTSSDSSRQRTADASGMQRSKLTSAEFVKKAGASGAAEVEAGKLGSQKATSPEVKAFAQKMVTDHTKANKELMAAAKTKNLEVPTEPDMMHKAMMEKFERQKADADFDHDFMQQMVRDHEKVVELFEQASTDTNVDAELRSWAKKTLPHLQAHLKEAQTLEGKLAKND
jgi:putative membrane protein